MLSSVNAARFSGSPVSDPLRVSRWPFQVVEPKPRFGGCFEGSEVFLHLEGGHSELV